jgi:ABC-type multidrug transport system fused ATPase/permease subunit
MSTPFSHKGQRDLLAQLVELVARRTTAERETAANDSKTKAALEQEFRKARKQSTATYEAAKSQLQTAYDDARRAALGEFEQSDRTLRERYNAAVQAAVERIDADVARVRARQKESRWEIGTLYDTSKNQPAQRESAVKRTVAEIDKQLEELDKQAQHTLLEQRQSNDVADPPAHAPADVAAAKAQLESSVSACRKVLAELAANRAATWVNPAMLVGVFCIAFAAGVAPAGFALGWTNPIWAAICLVLGVGATAAVYFYARPRAQRHAYASYLALRQIDVDNHAAAELLVREAAAQRQREQHEMLAKRDAALCEVDLTAQTALGKSAVAKQEQLAAFAAQLEPQAANIASRRDTALAEADATYPPQIAELEERYRAETETIAAANQSAVVQQERDHQAAYDAYRGAWTTGMSQFISGVAAVHAVNRKLFLDWNADALPAWTPPSAVPPGIRFGQFDINLAQIRGGIPDDAALRPAETRFTLPAILPFPQRGSLMLKGAGDALALANATLQAVMLRLLTSIPPGKVRFTICDAIGLGENFSAFMHLADYEEALVTSRIWTEQAQIEQRLADLTEHMENVIQKYLRNEFKTLEDYNHQAGEVAEPYRFLVVANFPAGFNEGSLRRLRSIASAGPRCGVFLLMSVDARQALPVNFNLAEIEETATVLKFQDGRFRWHHPDFEKLTLELDRPASAERFTEIVRQAGQAAKDSKRVEVPFETVAPKGDAWWTESAAAGVNVPLGRAGATKLQQLRLGKGTSQHVLVAGKTGSGKSTLLHALVTNAALRFSPDEVEFYLIDFKKGVEFKVYATHRLPHARVIAIESEREFGLSVLERLDIELKRRGELFRDAGVQDLPGYRKARPDDPLPRSLLVVDEFQELFVEDDKLAQDAALLLDRLVRQGRAFGIHVLLGSQTLGGAYSLARTTLGQMAVRIALQCSEADAHLILSEENTAARLLSRPGEAIYNDANGLVEGNHPFQVVWLGDDLREQYLRDLKQLAERREVVRPAPIVFEGNAAADLAGNTQIRHWLEADAWPAAPKVNLALLGAAVAIKEPTHLALRRQSGANLLVVGQQPASARGVLSSMLVSLALQHAPAGNGVPTSNAVPSSNSMSPGTAAARFVILDGTPADSADAGAWSQLADALPHAVSVVAGRGLGDAIAEVDQLVAEREKDRTDDAPPIFLFVYDLGRLRDLRKADDDFGFSSFSSEAKTVSPSKQFTHILREGPALGVHTFIWSDTYNNVTRSLDRNALKDFEMRVLFAMTGVDSSNLIDTPAASKLGPHRALLYTEEQGRLEKFRPYAAPSAELSAEITRRLAQRAAEVAQAP